MCGSHSKFTNLDKMGIPPPGLPQFSYTYNVECHICPDPPNMDVIYGRPPLLIKIIPKSIQLETTLKMFMYFLSS